jgi:quinol monooxygenase YgiN
LIPARKRREVLAVLESTVEQIRHTEGCTGCRLYRDVQEVGALLITESAPIDRSPVKPHPPRCCS